MPKKNESAWQEAKDAVNYPKSDPKYWPTVQMIYQRKIGSSIIIGARIIRAKLFRTKRNQYNVTDFLTTEEIAERDAGMPHVKKVRWDEMNVHPKQYRQVPFTSFISGNGSGNYPDEPESKKKRRKSVDSSSMETTRLQNPHWRQDDYSEDDDTWRSMFS